MGPKAYVKVHEGWSEPIISWGVIVAHKGQKKSPALGCFHRELTKIEELKNNTSKIQPQIFVEHFSFEELHYTMKHSNRILGLYDELSLLYEQLDRYKAGQADRKTILTLMVDAGGEIFDVQQALSGTHASITLDLYNQQQ